MFASDHRVYESSKPRWKHSGRARAPSSRRASGSGEVWLRCVRCGQNIARDQSRQERAGRNEHREVNAHGAIWVFECFADAPGARSLGEPTDAFTWFPGYRWRVAECSGCAFHLGWFFADGTDAFWALISERLA